MKRLVYWVIFVTGFISITTSAALSQRSPLTNGTTDDSPPVVVPTFPTARPWQDVKLLRTLQYAHWGPIWS